MNDCFPETSRETAEVARSLESQMRVRFDGAEMEEFFGHFEPMDITETILSDLGQDFW